MRESFGKGSGPVKLRSHLVLLVLATLLPLVAFAALSVFLFTRQEQRAIERGLVETVRALAVAVDRELRASISTLEALAVSRAIDATDLRTTTAEMARILLTQPYWRQLTLVEASGRIVAHTAAPPGALLPSAGDREYFRRVLESGQPHVSDLLEERVAHQPAIVVAVPVLRDRRVAFVLGAAVDPAALNEIFRLQGVSADWTGAILDRRRTIIARSRAAERFIGRRATGVLAARAAESPEGSFWDVTQEGRPSFGAFSRSAASGWTIVLGMPADAMLLPLRRSSWAVTGGAVVLVGVGVGLALLLGRRIARSIEALTSSAQALGRGETPPPLPSAVEEVRQVGRALERAGTLLVERRRESERAEERFRGLVNDVDAIVWEAEAATARIVFISQRVEEKLGYPVSRWMEEPGLWASIADGDDREEARRRFAEASTVPGHHDFEYRASTADGRAVWLRNIVSCLAGPDGRPRRLRGVTVDVTARKLAESRLLAETEAVDTVNRLGQILSAELDVRKLLQAVTDAATHVAGAEVGAFFHDAADERGAGHSLFAISGAPREAFAHLPMPRSTDLFGITYRGEGVVRLDDVRLDPRFGRNAPYQGMPPGHLPVTSYLAVPVVSRSGDVLGGLFLAHSRPAVFTEREERIVVGLAAQAAVAIDNARLYERAQHAREEAEQANRLKDEFLATLSHELRTPLNAVLGWTRMLQGGRLDAGTAAHAVDVIRRNAEAQVQLIEDLLDVSRITTGKLRLDPRRLEVPDVVREALDALHPAAAARSIELTSTVLPGCRPVSGDADRLRQVAWNLVSNAIKFTPRGGRVEVLVRPADEHVEIVVSDTGRGIPPDVLPHVFDRFRQADSTSTRAHGGLGLGLALVKHLVELHGGTVSAESAGEGQGATFTVRLPPIEPRPAALATATGPPAGTDASLAGVRVLVVEDDADALEMFTRLLEAHGADVRGVPSAAGALAALEA